MYFYATNYIEVPTLQPFLHFLCSFWLVIAEIIFTHWVIN